MTIESLLLAGAIILFAYFVRGIAGFGSGLLAVPTLALFLPLTLVVPLVLVTDLVASAILGERTRRDIRWDEIRALLPTAAVGVVLGTTLLVGVADRPLLLALSLLILVFGVRSVLLWQGERPVSRRWAIPSGLAGGTASGLFGTGGPPYAIYLSHRIHDKAALRATFSGLFLIEGLIRLIVAFYAGLFWQPDLGLGLAISLPVVILGLYFGHRVHTGLTGDHMIRIIGVLLLLSGASLLWKAWG